MTDDDLLFTLDRVADFTVNARSAARIRELVAERDEARQHVAELQEKLDPNNSCACSYDFPGTICGHHSPMLAKAKAEAERLRGLLREARGHMVSGAGIIQSPDHPYLKLLARIDAALATEDRT